MIQRIQSLFLLATSIMAIVLLFVPFFTISDENIKGSFSLLTATGSVSNAYYLMILNNMVILLSIITIFLFKKRTVQFKLSNLLVLLNVFIIGLSFLLNFENQLVIKTTFWAFFPIIGAVFSFFAAHFIKKDELLVRSADRIR